MDHPQEGDCVDDPTKYRIHGSAELTEDFSDDSVISVCGQFLNYIQLKKDDEADCQWYQYTCKYQGMGCCETIK